MIPPVNVIEDLSGLSTAKINNGFSTFSNFFKN